MVPILSRLPLLALLCAAVALGNPAENLWTDASFEASGNCDDAHSGAKALRFTMDKPQYYRECGGRQLKVEPFAVYQAEAYVKANVPSGSGTVLVAYGWNSFGWDFMSSAKVTKLDAWTRVTSTFCVPANTVTFTPIVLNHAANAAITLDDLTITRVKTAQQHLDEMKAAKTPTENQRKLLARHYLATGQLQKAIDLKQGAPYYVQADIDCIVAKATDDPEIKRRHIISMVANAALATPDGKDRLAEFFRGLTPEQQFDICRAAVRAADAKHIAQAVKAFEHLTVVSPATIAPLQPRLADFRALRQKLADFRAQLPADAQAIAATLDRQLAQLDEQSRQLQADIDTLGHATVVLNGQPLSPKTHLVVIPDEPTPTERQAANELVVHLELITGQLLDIVHERDAQNDTRRPIAIGKTTATHQRLGHAVPFDQLGTDGIHLHADDRGTILAGNVRGVLYAVYTLLEDHLGCRWFANDCNVTPREGTLTVPTNLDTTYVPKLEYRCTDYPTARIVPFGARNRYNGMYMPNLPEWGGKLDYKGFVHTFDLLVPPSVYGATHPEYYSEINGKRVTTNSQLCLTNPDVRRIATETVRRWIQEAAPNRVIVSVSQNDRYNFCTCKNCSALAKREGSQSGPLLHFVNAIAADIAKDYPDQIIDTLAYQYTRKPPKHVKPLPNVVVRLCSIECCFAHPLETCPRNRSFVEDIRAWSKICRRLHIWDYVINYAHCVMPFPNIGHLGANIDFFVRNGVTGIYEEACYFSRGAELAELRGYIMAKALWDPKTDMQRHIREFTDAYYGPAAPFIQDYLRRLQLLSTTRPNTHAFIYSPPAHYLNEPDFIQAALDLFDKARAAVADAPVLRHRVNLAMMPIIYTQATLADAAWTHDGNRLVSKHPFDPALIELFAQTAKAEKADHLREGCPTSLAEWVEQKRRKTTTLDNRVLENDHLRLEVIPDIGGRIWRAFAKNIGQDVIHNLGNERDGWHPLESGFEFYPGEGYRHPGWDAPYTVLSHTRDSITLQAKLADGATFTRTIALLPDRAAFSIHNELASNAKTGKIVFRNHPAFRVSATASAVLHFTAQNGKRFSRSLANPRQTEAEFWFRDADRPDGSWTIEDLNAGYAIVNTFPKEQLRTAYCNYNRDQKRVNLEMWANDLELPSDKPVVLDSTFEVVPRKKLGNNHRNNPTMTTDPEAQTAIIASDFVPADGVTDAADAIQMLIDANPNRTIYFPDGTYLISKPILTPAHPKRSVSLKLAAFAVIKAAPDWNSDEAMIRLGAAHPANDIYTIGSNYGISGGFIDGDFRAKGISIDGGRETAIADINLKHVKIGIHIKRGANSGSSDADIKHVNITGDGSPDAIGVLIEGHDNTFTDMRIAAVNTGVLIRSGGNSLRNIHPLYTYGKQATPETYATSCGFVIRSDNNWLDYCYSDQFATGFRLTGNTCAFLTNCFAYWYGERFAKDMTCIEAEGAFSAVVNNIRASFRFRKPTCTLLKVGKPGGKGVLVNPVFNSDFAPDDTYLQYLQGAHIRR